jgi:hypothetical protein
MMTILEKCGLIHTPESMEALLQWIEKLNGSERAVAMVAAGMAWNLASSIVDEHFKEKGN